MDLGFHLVEDFLTDAEEKEYVRYWGPGSEIYDKGASEQKSKRRFFNYGPILPKARAITTKSILGVIPALCGDFPESVKDLSRRLQHLCFNRLDQKRRQDYCFD